MTAHSSTISIGQTGRRSHVRHDRVGAELQQTIWSVCIVLGVLGLASANPAVTFFGFLVPPVLFALLWRPGEPPILLFAAAFQWIQAFAHVLSADLEGQTLQQTFRGPELEMAAWLSLLGVIAVACGMRLATSRMTPIDGQAVGRVSLCLSRRKLFKAYVAGMFLSTMLTIVSSYAGGLRQPILAIAAIKWIPLFLICWTTMRNRKPYGWMMAAVAIEIVIGFTGFFSQFKTVLFLLIVITVGTGSSRKSLPRLQLIGIMGFTLLLVMFWQAIKVEYRSYLNQGTGAQVVAVPFQQRLTYLARAATEVTPARMQEGLTQGIRRLGYINFFAHSIRYVPAVVPHQEGDLWIGSVKHVFMPRSLFPDKPEIDASARTNKFTGLGVAGRDRGTSISIGFVGESYIDFGVIWMFLPLVLLGGALGLTYRWFCRLSCTPVLGMALATTTILRSSLQLETSNITLVGGLITGFVAMFCLQKYVGPAFIALVSRRPPLTQSAHRHRATLARAA